MDSIKKSKIVKVLLIIVTIILLWTVINSIRINALDANIERGQAQTIGVDVGGWSLPPEKNEDKKDEPVPIDEPIEQPAVPPGDSIYDIGDNFYWGWNNGPYIYWKYWFDVNGGE